MRDAVFATDYDANKIRKIDVASGEVTTFAGSGAATSFDGVGTLAAFNGPHGIAVDQVGSVYVTDNIGCRIRWIVVATGAVTTLAGSGVASSSDGLGTAATFNYPQAVVADADTVGGNLYISEAVGRKIRKIVISSGVVTTLAGSGAASTVAVDGTGTAATLSGPECMALDGKGNLYFTDDWSNTVRKIVIATQVVTTLAGSGREASVDGVGLLASFNIPRGIALDAFGNALFISEAEGIFQGSGKSGQITSGLDTTGSDLFFGGTWSSTANQDAQNLVDFYAHLGMVLVIVDGQMVAHW